MMAFNLDYKTQITTDIQEVIDDVYRQIKWDIGDIITDFEHAIDIFHEDTPEEIVEQCKDFLEELSNIINDLECLQENFE